MYFEIHVFERLDTKPDLNDWTPNQFCFCRFVFVVSCVVLCCVVLSYVDLGVLSYVGLVVLSYVGLGVLSYVGRGVLSCLA